MYKLSLVLSVCFLSSLALSGQVRPSSADLQEIQRLEMEWNRINEESDVAGVEQLLADDSYHVGPSGRLYTKQQDVEAQRASRERKVAAGSRLKFFISNQRIRIFKDVAVVTATGQSITTLADGTRRLGNLFRTVHVWEKRDGRWVLTVDQVTGVAR